jgi:hypothetical protein
MNSNLLQSDQLITPAGLAGPNEAHLRDSFLLGSAKFNFQPQLQQPPSNLEDSTGLQGFQGPNRLELPGPEFSNPNYTSLRPFVNEEPHPLDTPSGPAFRLPSPASLRFEQSRSHSPTQWIRPGRSHRHSPSCSVRSKNNGHYGVEEKSRHSIDPYSTQHR